MYIDYSVVILLFFIFYLIYIYLTLVCRCSYEQGFSENNFFVAQRKEI